MTDNKNTSNINPVHSDNFNLLDYIEIIVNNLRMIIHNTFFAVLIAIVISLCIKNKYRSTAMILPPQQDSGMMGMMLGAMTGGTSGGIADLLGKGTTADLYVSILKSNAINDKIIDRFKLMDLYKEEYRTKMYKSLEKDVAISAGKKDGIISISVMNKDSKLAADIANAYIEELEKSTISLNIKDAKDNMGYLEKRITKTKIDLSTAEENLKRFQSKNKALSVTEQVKATIDGISQLRAQLAMKEIELSALQRQFTDSSQEIKNTKNLIANIRSQIATLEGKGGKASSSIPSIGAVPKLGEEYVRLMREMKTQEVIFELLTKQYEIAKLTEAKDIITIQVLQKARAADKKVTPKRSLIVITSAVAAGFLSLIYAFTLEASKGMRQEDRERWNNIKSFCTIKTIISICLSPQKRRE